ncbi:accessory Sec system S-layer assembly protein [Metabacillus fastidiosus]|uniref:accessory Sec system S-layer assembly protein n=1 Tax=Metabacillus fastidiosus TaxID=1458 RepID=UPI003D2992B6
MSTTNQIETVLSIHPDWNVSKQEMYVYQFQHQQLESLKENQISISGLKLEQFDQLIYVTAFIRNTLPNAITFEMLDLIILDENKQMIAKETFDMEKFGELPSMGCRPWSFVFERENWNVEEEPTKLENWQIAFEIKKKPNEIHELELDTSWEDKLSKEMKEHLQQLVNNMPPLKENEINIMGLEAQMNEQRNLVVTLLIRNGSLKNINLEQLPLIVEDASKNVIAKGVFNLTNFEVRANTSKPWTFIFPSDLILNANPDLSSWKVYPPKTEQ